MPTAPHDLDHMEPVISSGMFNVTLTWSRPDPPNGIIILYIVSSNTNYNNL